MKWWYNKQGGEIAYLAKQLHLSEQTPSLRNPPVITEVFLSWLRLSSAQGKVHSDCGTVAFLLLKPLLSLFVLVIPVRKTVKKCFLHLEKTVFVCERMEELKFHSCNMNI